MGGAVLEGAEVFVRLLGVLSQLLVQSRVPSAIVGPSLRTCFAQLGGVVAWILEGGGRDSNSLKRRCERLVGGLVRVGISVDGLGQLVGGAIVARYQQVHDALAGGDNGLVDRNEEHEQDALGA